MITINEAEVILKNEYHIDNYQFLINECLLPDFSTDIHEVSFDNDLFSSVTYLGSSALCDVSVFEVYVNEGCQNRRVAITQEMFRILRSLHTNNALVAFSNSDKKNYRISLLTSKYEFEGDKIVKVLSNPRRFSYSLGCGTKTKTAYKYLIKKGQVNSLNELIDRFSVEVVNKEFYTHIATSFTELVGGERNGKTYEKLLDLYGVVDHNKYAEFAVRLIGRIMFCWFLKEKRSENGTPLVPEDMLSVETINKSTNYYHQILEPLFFELLNTNQRWRKKEYQEEYYYQVPFLNGGLFCPHNDDRYKYDSVNQCGKYGVVTIPNEWFVNLYSVLNEYNFTVDENTAYDIELSIDPEMLGRIFENLLAEINPETGENAKKSTGSFYTPRDIVDYMVDSSLCEYLKNKTGIDDVKLSALISYTKEDDHLAVFSKTEKKKIINALFTITVLDPACGSGAFPIGMLQKIVYILQELDPDAELWFDKATENVSIFIKKEFEKKFNSGSLNYIRKLSVIQNSIFGIDIQPIAVEISRLRCFLSLIIEEHVHDEEENRGINPLPNLDFKFIIANSLKRLPDDSQTALYNHGDQLSLFENLDFISQLKSVREEYFNAEIGRKAELKLEFSNIQKQMLQEILDRLGRNPSDRYRALIDWAPFENKVTNWFEPDWMFGINDGFDIVIGNPPYIGFHNVPDKEYNKNHFISANGKYDYYVLFIEKAIQLCNINGFVSFICPSYFYKRNYGKKIRELILKKTSILFIADFSDFQIFESVQTYTCIFGISKKQKEDNAIRVLNKSLSDLDSHFINQSKLKEPSWNLDERKTNTIIEKVNRNTWKTFGDITKSISQGIVTGNNSVFLISENLISQRALESIYLKRAYKGKDVFDKQLHYSGYRVFYPYVVNERNKTVCISEEELKKNSPNLYEYLLEKKDLLLSREYFVKSNKLWFELWNCRKKEHFYNRKFVFSELGLKNDFAIVDECFYTDSVCGAELKDDYKMFEGFIHRYLNSKLATFVYKKISVPKANGYSIYKNAFLKVLPIIQMDDNYNDLMSDQEFDNYLYERIGLTETETTQIENIKYSQA